MGEAVERAAISVVQGGGDDDVPAAPGSGERQDGLVSEPRQDPSTLPAAPPQELNRTDLGGEALRSPTEDEKAAAAGASIADRMRARYAAISATQEFPVPGWELENGDPGLILEAKAMGDRKAFNEGMANEVFIARSTHRLFFVNDDGKREEVPGGWGPGLAGIIGVPATKAADLVALVISKPDPDNPGQRIPNVAGITALALQLVGWAQTGRAQAEEELGG